MTSCSARRSAPPRSTPASRSHSRAPRPRSSIRREARTSKPSLVILDLNSTALEPIETLGALKADAALAGIPTLGFVSHVDTARIQAAREAGADQVMARSAFAGQLAEILLAGTGQP
jgi:DNA-binding NarL/FixJ family response regulator